jgi:hypothetical protein
MDTDEILQKLIKWLSDPKSREIVKTVVYLIFPLFIILALRSAVRRRPAEKKTTAIEPKIRPSSYKSPTVTENIKETMAREQKKIAMELQEVFGREDTTMTRAKRAQTRADTPGKSPQSEPSEPNEKKMLQEELLKLFMRRPN